MKVWTSRIAATADLRDDLSSFDDLPSRHVQNTAVSIARISVNRGMINQNLVAVAVIEIISRDNLPVEQRADIRAIFITQINARMKLPFAGNGMNAPTERRSDWKINRLRGRWQNQSD